MISKFFILIIQFYQACISPFKRACCRHYPSCAEFSSQHIDRYGATRSFLPIFKRVFSCHPFSRKGFWDPVK